MVVDQSKRALNTSTKAQTAKPRMSAPSTRWSTTPWHQSNGAFSSADEETDDQDQRVLIYKSTFQREDDHDTHATDSALNGWMLAADLHLPHPKQWQAQKKSIQSDRLVAALRDIVEDQDSMVFSTTSPTAQILHVQTQTDSPPRFIFVFPDSHHFDRIWGGLLLQSAHAQRALIEISNWISTLGGAFAALGLCHACTSFAQLGKSPSHMILVVVALIIALLFCVCWCRRLLADAFGAGRSHGVEAICSGHSARRSIISCQMSRFRRIQPSAARYLSVSNHPLGLFDVNACACV
jgi:hypothetical protein